VEISVPALPAYNRSERVSKTRWKIVWVLFFSTVTNYISRQSFSVLSPMITSQYHLTHSELAKILGAFQIAYAITWLIGGMILDAVGCRLGLALAAIWWSTMNILTGLAGSVFGFASCRFLLGLGEGFNWPGASKVVAEWFPSEERSLAVAIFDSGSSVGGALAALAIPLIALAFGWRFAFAAAGMLGFVWVAVWLRTYYPLGQHPRVSEPEVALIQAGRPPAAPTQRGAARWKQLARNPALWGIVVGRSLTDPIWWFYVFWLPQYLSDTRGFSLQQISMFAWMPFVAADIGNFSGGWISGLCIRHGMSAIGARKAVCAASCIPILAGIPAAAAHSAYLALALICIALWGFASWSTMGLTLPSDLFPAEVVGSVTGLSGLAAGLVGVGFTLLVGLIVDKFSYRPAFLAAGLMPIVATLFLYLLIRRPREVVSV
jgi:ACS family hexuronate transporter-like MFS transporter